jgi:hypothetical protein
MKKDFEKEIGSLQTNINNSTKPIIESIRK